jgi:hypothetical protein
MHGLEQEDGHGTTHAVITERMRCSYVLPIRLQRPMAWELEHYLRDLGHRCEVIVVDRSVPSVFAANASRLAPGIKHIAVDDDLLALSNGKVAGVIAGLRLASHDRVIVADDDIRYDEPALSKMVALLEKAEVVRVQNYFRPLPWHAWLDTGRTLINRISGGDWPGTLGIRTHALPTMTYDGDVLFENLELVRTIRAAGGREVIASDLFVRRLPPSTTHFWSQRVRQAYDEFARPARLAIWLAVLPVTVITVLQRRFVWLGLASITVIALAETGRRRHGGRAVFPWYCALAAPLWVAERALCAWIAVGMRLLCGGVRYHGKVLVRAATPMRLLQRRAVLRRT